MALSRRAQSGQLVRLMHGVYRDAGCPIDPHETLRATWLSLEPQPLAHERLATGTPSVVVSGETACVVHGMGDLPGSRMEFSSPIRRQTTRNDVRLRTRSLPSEDITIIDGLPVTTRERTIADLVDARYDLSIIADTLRDAADQSNLNYTRLASLLEPHQRKYFGSRRTNTSLLDLLLHTAGLDHESVASRIAHTPELGAAVARKYLETRLGDISGLDETIQQVIEHLQTTDPGEAAISPLVGLSEALGATATHARLGRRATEIELLELPAEVR